MDYEEQTKRNRRSASNQAIQPIALNLPSGLITSIDHRDLVVVKRTEYEQMKFKLQNVDAILAAQRDFVTVVHSIDKLTTNIVFAAIHVGKGETLRSGLQALNAHVTLAGRLMDFGDIVKASRSGGIELPLDEDTIRNFSHAVKDFADCCRLVEQGQSDGDELIGFIRQKATTFFRM